MDRQRRVTGPDATPEDIEARRTSFGGVAVDYDRVRPEWPAQTVTWLVGSPSPQTRLRVLDLGAGTGKGSRAIATLGHDVVAVDPSEGMLAALERSLPGLPPPVRARIRTVAGGAESLPLEDASVDAVTVLQAWHWFDQDAAAAECARVLRPGGHLTLAWHTWDGSTPWVDELAEVVGRPEMATPVADEDAPRVAGGFDPVERRDFRYDHALEVEGLVRLASSWSYVAVRADREDVLARVRVVGERVADADGRLVFPNITVCYRFRRR